MHSSIEELLKLAAANGASDIHLASDMEPRFRINGKLEPVSTFKRPEGMSMSDLILSVPTKEMQLKFMAEKEVDFSLAVEGVRFRCNLYFEKGQVGLVLRVIPGEVPEITKLNLPPILNSFIKYKQGFVLVTGPTGHGKSTTVASMLNEINKNDGGHIVTIEDPVEYVISPVKAMITQRELGTDTVSFEKALRSVLRQDPNVVFVGEMRDLETIQLAMTVAETGHLVFSTLHTNSASQTIDRIVDVFPEGTKPQIKNQLAMVLTAVVSQRLVPSLDGGRVPAVEILVSNPAVRNMIRESKTFMTDNIIQTGGDVGMISQEMSLAKLVREGKISEEVAMNFALKPADLQSNLRLLSQKDGKL